MNHDISVARTQYGHVINTASAVRKQVRHFDATFAVPFKFGERAQQLGVILDELILRFTKRLRSGLTIEAIQQRLGIKRLHVAGATRHK